ncbi:hypothetical protein [Spirosoma pulveris]
MKKALIGTMIIALGLLGYACKDDDENPIATTNNPVQLTATLNGASGGSTTTTGTGSFTGSLNQGTTSGSTQSSSVLSYTVNYSGITATAITLDPVGTSTSAATGTSYANSILLAGIFPSTTTTPGSGTSTVPGSGTSTTPGSGTTTTPGSGTSTTPGSGTSTTPGSGTSTTPGSGTSTTPGSGTSTTPGSGTSTTPGSGTAVALTSPISGTVSVSQSRADSISRGLYQLNIRSANYPNGEIGGAVRVR